ncbi:4Fe-4S binding domain-containing protein [Dethiosulfatibacter aminovorans DSM 17477]|uniref:4Fe-4S binding domain-containing protein n=1 Tax=Dethiosulfatibacter aminovorans DSM 17477 TaxID=1121476 RepID=A0A1M6IWX2_9FIRM|nr:(2Fe-2S)-binding protein [Dethiosulfatibacter aminovorans]SHJ38874.1 4Fe-4S binding domain-containing protein [Dethiosulfatibacter aminovorans DSM 17477]
MENNQVMKEKVIAKLPSPERRRKGPYALIECFQKIPCNPCYTSCKFGAVKEFNDINDLPEIDYDKCTGCGLCQAVCPGLAIFVIDETYSNEKSLIKIPYEYLPVPSVGDIVKGYDRDGNHVSDVEVKQVRKFKNNTHLVNVAVEKKLEHDLRGIAVRTESRDGEWKPESNKLGECIVCRCEDISMEEIKNQIALGKTTVKEIKLATRGSMGPCQGKTCLPIILKELSKATGKSIEELESPNYRQPIKPVKIGKLVD